MPTSCLGFLLPHIARLVSILALSVCCPRFEDPVCISTMTGPLANGELESRHVPMVLFTRSETSALNRLTLFIAWTKAKARVNSWNFISSRPFFTYPVHFQSTLCVVIKYPYPGLVPLVAFHSCSLDLFGIWSGGCFLTPRNQDSPPSLSSCCSALFIHKPFPLAEMLSAPPPPPLDWQAGS